MKSRTLSSLENDPDGPMSDTSSCGYHNALLNWLTGGFSRPAKHQQSRAVWVDIPHVENDNNEPEADGSLFGQDVQDKSDDKMIDMSFKPLSTNERNETWMTTSELVTVSQSGIVPTKLYTATAEVISVLE